MTVVLKQWKTNISHADKTNLSSHLSLCPSSPADVSFSLWVSLVSLYLLFFLSSVSLSLLLTLKTSKSRHKPRTGQRCSLQDQGEAFMCWKIHTCTYTHMFSWTHGVTSPQSGLPVLVKGTREQLNGCEVFLVSREEQPLMILSGICPKRKKCWDLLTDTSAWWASGASCQKTTNESSNRAKPSRLKPLIFFFFCGVWFAFFVV